MAGQASRESRPHRRHALAAALLLLAGACADEPPPPAASPLDDLGLCSPLRSLDKRWELSVHRWGRKGDLVALLQEPALDANARPIGYDRKRLAAYLPASIVKERLDLDIAGSKVSYNLLKPKPNVCVLRRIGGGDLQRDTFVGSKLI